MNAFNRAELRALLIGPNANVENFLTSNEVLDVVLSKRFGVEYHPITDIQSGEIQGYQARAQFWDRNNRLLDTQDIFAYLQQNPLLLFHTELELKRSQIARFPGEGWLMLDLAIESFIEGGAHENPFLELFSEYVWTDRELVINLIESSKSTSNDDLHNVIASVQQTGIALVVEEVGLSRGMFSLNSLLDARMIRINGSLLRAYPQEAMQTAVEWLTSVARRLGVETIMTGIDTCEQLEWARKMSIENAQGRLFSRNNIQLRNF